MVAAEVDFWRAVIVGLALVAVVLLSGGFARAARGVVSAVAMRRRPLRRSKTSPPGPSGAVTQAGGAEPVGIRVHPDAVPGRTRMLCWLPRPILCGMRKTTRRHRRQRTLPLPRREERASGEEAIATRDESEAEATPSHMNRLKTSRL
jgi:hypothetical protein